MQMKKAYLILLLGSLLLPANVGAQEEEGIVPYNRKNTQGYVFDGHTLEEVVVKPYDNSAPRKEISMSRDVANDDQVVYLYNPATGLFLNTGGTWSTEAVGLYKGFGLAFNIVDPTGAPELGTFVQPWKNDPKFGIGFYNAASPLGQYLGRDGNKHAGEPEFSNGQNKIRFYVDRGGHGDEKLQCELPTYNGKYAAAEDDHIFTWHLEQINKGDNNLNVYHLSLYVRNQGLSGADNDPDRNVQISQYFKHYVKFEQIDPFDENPYYALTTERTNKVSWDQLPGHYHVFAPGEPSINSDEAIPTGPEYEWQIITRRDLKQKFVLDFDDPYAVTVELGNANFNLDNPDFSRSLNETINSGGQGKNTYWLDPNGAYDFNINTWENSPYGRYAFLHPKKDGEFTQTFQPLQFGLFDVDVQGFSLKSHDGAYPTAKLSLVTNTAKIGHTQDVEFEVISDEDKEDLYWRIGDIARKCTDYRWHYKEQIWDGYREPVVTDQNIFKYTNTGYRNWHNEEKLDGVVKLDDFVPGFIDVRADNGNWDQNQAVNPANYSEKGLYRILYIDDFGHVCKGIYINGRTFRNDGGLGPYEDDHVNNHNVGRIVGYGFQLFRDGENVTPNANQWGWADDEDGTIEVEVGDNVVFGPFITGNGYFGGDNNLIWFTPREVTDPKEERIAGSRELTIENITYDDAGDYFCTYHDGDNRWNVVRYHLVVNTKLGLKDDVLTPPQADFVNINGTGLPYAVDETASFTHALTSRNRGSFGGANGVKEFQNAVAATDRTYLERGIGSFFYENPEKYKKTVSFYLPEGNQAENEDVTIKLTADGVGADFMKNIAAIDNVRVTYRGDSPYIIDEYNAINKNKSYATGNSRIPTYMNRLLDVDAWNAFVCPLPLNGQQVINAFGENVVISEIEDLGLYPNDPYTIHFKSKEDWKKDLTKIAIIPGHFYLLKPSALDYQQVTIVQVTRDNAGIISKIEAKAYESEGATVYGDAGENIGQGHFIYLGTHDLRLPQFNGDVVDYNNYAPDKRGRETGNELAVPVKKVDGAWVLDQEQMETYNPYAPGSKYPTQYMHPVTLVDVDGNEAPATPYRKFYSPFYFNTDEGYDVDHNRIELIASYIPQTIKADVERQHSYVFQTKPGESRLVHLSAEGDPITLKGFRFYIHDIEQLGNADGSNFSFAVDGVQDNDETNKIINALVDEKYVDGDIYNISGQKVQGKLPKGVYVKNGKKFFVK